MKHLLYRCLLLTLMLTVTAAQAHAADDMNAKKAADIFNKVYTMVMGEEGSSLHYTVNIIGMYKTEGDIIYKGKKSYFEEARFASWDNGSVTYKADKKKEIVNIYRSDDDSKDQYMSKFKYDVNNFDFSYVEKGDYYEVTARVRNAKFFGVREAKVMILKKNLHPTTLTVKVAFMRATINITNFKAGNISDNSFVFPSSRFKNYATEDHRNNPVNK